MRAPLICALLLSLLAVGPAAAADRQVILEPYYDGGGYVATTIRIQLVDATNKPVLALRAPDGTPITTDRSYSLKYGPQQIELTPQTDIARALPAAPDTWYRIRVSAGRVKEDYRVQVAEGAEPLGWSELIQAGAPLVPAQLSALQQHKADDTRHLPADAAEGRFARMGAAGEWEAVTVAPGGGVTDHGDLTGLGDDDHSQYALSDGSRGSFATTAQGALADTATQPADLSAVASSGAAGDVSVAAAPGNYSAATADVEAHLAGIDTALGGLGGGHDPVTLTGAYDYATLAGQQITLGKIDLTADVTGALPWASVGSTPTTLAGYGITDAALQSALDVHEADAANPHSVTAAQAGADPAGSAAAVQTDLDTHEADAANPHAVTATQVGALPISGGTLTGAVRVQGYDLAMPAEFSPGASFEAPMNGVPSRLLLTQNLILSAAAGTDLAVSQIWLQQDATGGWTVTVPGTWKWIGGTAKAVATDPNEVTFIVLRRNPWSEIEIAVIDYSVPTP